MKKLIIAAFVSLVAISAASADSYPDLKRDQINLSDLPATAADRSTQDVSANLFPEADQR